MRSLSFGLVSMGLLFIAGRADAATCPAAPTNWDAEDCVVGGSGVCQYSTDAYGYVHWDCTAAGTGGSANIFIVENFSATSEYEAWGDINGTPFCCSSNPGGRPDIIDIHGSSYDDTLQFYWTDGVGAWDLQKTSAASINLGAFIYGGDGADVITGSRAFATSYGEYLYGQAGEDLIVGQDGDDTLQGDGGDDTCYAGGYEDQVLGLDEDDVLAGEGGIDHIWGGAGLDTLSGGTGDDEMYGEGDADTMHGNDGYDGMDGGAGNDKIYGDNQGDVISGDDGDDECYGGAGDDQLSGGAGSDKIKGDDGADLLYGDADNDFISGGSQDDYLNGGTGNDVLCGDGEGAGGDELDDGDAAAGVDLLWAASNLDLGDRCGNVSTQWDCMTTELAGLGTCGACLPSRPSTCP